eukprot:4779487-Pleurochrysis_carterae.AAC.2
MVVLGIFLVLVGTLCSCCYFRYIRNGRVARAGGTKKTELADKETLVQADGDGQDGQREAATTSRKGPAGVLRQMGPGKHKVNPQGASLLGSDDAKELSIGDRPLARVDDSERMDNDVDGVELARSGVDGGADGRV